MNSPKGFNALTLLSPTMAQHTLLRLFQLYSRGVPMPIFSRFTVATL